MKEQRNSNEYHRADPGYRRRMQILLVVVLVVGGIGLFLLHRWLSGLDSVVAGGDLFAYERSLHLALGGVSLLLGAAAAAFATWLFRLSALTRSSDAGRLPRCVPPPTCASATSPRPTRWSRR